MRLTILAIFLVAASSADLQDLTFVVGEENPPYSPYLNEPAVKHFEGLKQIDVESSKDLSFPYDSTEEIELTDQSIDGISDFHFESLTKNGTIQDVKFTLAEQSGVITNVSRHFPTAEGQLEIDCLYRNREIATNTVELPQIKVEIKKMIAFEFIGYVIVSEGLFGIVLKDAQTTLTKLEETMEAPAEVKSEVTKFTDVFKLTEHVHEKAYMAAISNQIIFVFEMKERLDERNVPDYSEVFLFHYDISAYLVKHGSLVNVNLTENHLVLAFEKALIVFDPKVGSSTTLNNPNDFSLMHEIEDFGSESFVIRDIASFEGKVYVTLKDKGLATYLLGSNSFSNYLIAHPGVNLLNITKNESNGYEFVNVTIDQSFSNGIYEFLAEFIIDDEGLLRLNKVYSSKNAVNVTSLVSGDVFDYLVDKADARIYMKKKGLYHSISEVMYTAKLPEVAAFTAEPIGMRDQEKKGISFYMENNGTFLENNILFYGSEGIECKFLESGDFVAKFYTFEEDCSEKGLDKRAICKKNVTLNLKITGSSSTILYLVGITLISAGLAIIFGLVGCCTRRREKSTSQHHNKVSIDTDRESSNRENEIEVKVND